ncbi:glycosyltransferase involved in cell wall biosynthesis [Skermanella aerolata]|uniref:Colanic acid biosynthesis glycosyltransferase WcaL n=1 Tax=Skermanella aerolata TaxID=393310 RepID=A0A512DNU0_9PROT|nr:glycosyltransferase family 4 protein [Skermanella aerolata]GEO38139.1 colanic acid biosynthesis glycosyltransferase WcaL [Skermanella aerolata]
MPVTDKSICVVLKGWPRLSETFIAQELVGLERRGLKLNLFSLRHPTDKATHALHAQLEAPVTYLPEYLHDEPARVARALKTARRLPGWNHARKIWLKDLARDRTRNRVRRFGQAMVLAAELPPDTGRIYSHFLHTPSSVARYAALLTELPWSFSAHAKDIWTIPEWEKREKLADACWGVTCTRMGHAHLAGLSPVAERMELLYHGLEFGRFPLPPASRPPRTGGDPADPLILLSIGRAVEKKGFDVALAALALLPPDLSWRWVHIGGGAGLKALKAEAERLGLSDRIDWLGAQPQDVVIANLIAADLFFLPSRMASDGDRDGLPNVLMEAQIMGLPVAATRMAAIPELIVEDETGVLVDPGDAAGLAEALVALARDPAIRTRLATAGRERVRSHFSAEAGLDRLAGLLNQPEFFLLSLGERVGVRGSATSKPPAMQAPHPDPLPEGKGTSNAVGISRPDETGA